MSTHPFDKGGSLPAPPKIFANVRDISKTTASHHSGIELREIHTAIDDLYAYAADQNHRIQLGTLILEVVDDSTPEHPVDHFKVRTSALAKPIPHKENPSIVHSPVDKL